MICKIKSKRVVVRAYKSKFSYYLVGQPTSDSSPVPFCPCFTTSLAFSILRIGKSITKKMSKMSKMSKM